MFFSPDNYIQAPGNTQNYNRYAYCLNNPLKYTDPSGNRFTSDDVGYIALAGVFGTASWKPIFLYSFGNATTGQAIGMYAVNATAFVASAGVGSAVSSALGNIGIIPGLLTGASTGFVSGSIVGAGNAWVTGASFSDGINSGVKKGAIGMSIGAITGGLRGGLRVRHLEKMTGDDINIWNGKVITFGGPGSNLYASTGKDLVIGANGKPISESEGGIIKGKQEAKEFLVEQARNNKKEVALFGMEDENHVVQPWENNLTDESANNMRFVEKYNYTIEQIKYQMHSHPNGGGPSYGDVLASHKMKIPVYSVDPNGNVWLTYSHYWDYSVPLAIPIYEFPFFYGTIINW
jgi:proteasome lid subunit RPN8/RPN11